MITLLTLLMILLQGTESHDWSVTFPRDNLCAMKGSSVEFRCSYNYPVGETVHKTAWSKGELKNGEWARVELLLLPAIDNRSEYLGDLQDDCSLAIHDLQENDTGYYYFRFDTNMLGWRSRKNVYLSVTDVSAKVYPDKVKTGDYVTLECLTSCTESQIVWFKDGEPLSEPGFQAQPQDSGKYVCAVEGQESLQSDPVVLDVQYPPLNVSVEVSYTVHHSVKVSNSVNPPPVVAGSAVNLTCSSDANPAADNYTWYRRTDPTGSMLQVGSGQVLSVSSVEASHTGLYLCQARNQLGKSDSTEVLLTVEEITGNSPLNVSVEVSYTVHHSVKVSNSVNPPPVVAGSAVNLTCSSDPAADNYTWYRRTDPTGSMLQVGSGQVLSVSSVEASHTGLYLCQARNQLGKSNSTEVLLTVEEITDTGSWILLVALGVKIVIILLLSVVIVYVWQRIDKPKKDDEENCPDYENFPKAEMSF